MATALFFSIFAAFLQFIGYAIYTRKILQKKITPNAASWTIWAASAIFESLNYSILSGDLVKNLLPLACAISAIFIFFYCILYGHFKKIDRFDWGIIFFDIAITIYWFFSGQTFVANLLYILSAFISFIPIVRYVWNDPRNEESFPWYIWSVAYSFMFVAVFLRFEKFEDLVYPLAFFVLHLIVALLSSDVIAKIRKQKRHRQLDVAIDQI